jgi:hypothetical protein
MVQRSIRAVLQRCINLSEQRCKKFIRAAVQRCRGVSEQRCNGARGVAYTVWVEQLLQDVRQDHEVHKVMQRCHLTGISLLGSKIKGTVS